MFRPALRQPVLDLVPRNVPICNVANYGGVAGERYIGHELALKHLPGKQQLAVLVLVADGVADQRAIQGERQLGSEVAHLVGMRQQHQLRLLARIKCFRAAT